MSDGIRFAGPWAAVHQTEIRRIARMSDAGPAHVRLFLLALSEANRIGHAEFREGVLREFLGSANKATGEIKPCSPATVSHAIKAAVRLGMLSPESCAGCLVLPHTLFQKAGRGTGSCRYHGARTNVTRVAA